MMMMPIYPGAPWLPKFEGTEGKEKYVEWKAQTKGLLSTQEATEVKKVSIVLNTLAGEAKRQVMVVDAEERDTVKKIFEYLDSLYLEVVPAAKLRSQFYSCTQRSGESVASFVLRLRELACGLRRHNPATAPSDAVLRDQLLTGLSESALGQALRIYARRHPDDDFAALRQEALALDGEYGGTNTPEIACHAVNPASISRAPQPADWRDTLKKEIMDDVKLQMKGLTQELLREIKPLLQPGTVEMRPQSTVPPESSSAPPRDRYVPYQRNEWDANGRPICRRCQRAGHIARFCPTDQPALN